MQPASSKGSYPCFTILNPCVALCSMDSIHWVHHSREEESLDYDGGFVRLQIHMKFDTIVYHQQGSIIFFFSLVMGVNIKETRISQPESPLVTYKSRGLTNSCRVCYGQETRTNEPVSPLLWAR
jgi:hypothetical protein